MELKGPKPYTNQVINKPVGLHNKHEGDISLNIFEEITEAIKLNGNI
jgi:hypothetical protein